MTTVDTRRPATQSANPPVIDGVYAHLSDVPARNPHRFSTRASAVILLGVVAAQLTHVNGSDLEKGGAVFALLAAIVLFVVCLARFNARAKAGDR